MIQLRPGSERGRSKLGWLDSYHTFSFDRYYDPQHMSFRHLRVLNEDWVEGGKGFGMHPHRDMEIITYILEGALEHRDSLGTGSVIRPGEVQRMSAGRGITHSEYNPSATERVHLLQIWITPERLGIDPGYEQKTIPISEAGKGANGGLRLIAAPDGREGAVRIHQDAEVYAARLKGGAEAAHALKPGRHAWVQVAHGEVTLNGVAMKAGDGAAVSQEEEIRLRAEEGEAELLVFDLS